MERMLYLQVCRLYCFLFFDGYTVLLPLVVFIGGVFERRNELLKASKIETFCLLTLILLFYFYV